jgi:hypothetical protein
MRVINAASAMSLSFKIVEATGRVSEMMLSILRQNYHMLKTVTTVEFFDAAAKFEITSASFLIHDRSYFGKDLARIT